MAVTHRPSSPQADLASFVLDGHPLEQTRQRTDLRGQTPMQNDNASSLQSLSNRITQLCCERWPARMFDGLVQEVGERAFLVQLLERWVVFASVARCFQMAFASYGSFDLLVGG